MLRRRPQLVVQSAEQTREADIAALMSEAQLVAALAAVGLDAAEVGKDREAMVDLL